MIIQAFLVSAFLTFLAEAKTPETFRVLRCPAVPASYSEMLTELSVLKTTIKRDAACSPVQSEVASLEALLGARRKEVLDLVEKNKTEPLAEFELDKIRAYSEDVTRKVFATAEILDRNKNCFAEDNAPFSFSDLASITLDATAIAKQIAGPWSAPVAVGGQALAGIMRGLDRVVKSQRGYDFSKIEQRQSYLQSLCTYYNYRQDIENLLYPEQRVTQLQTLDRALRTGLNGMVKGCGECRQISELVQGGGDKGVISGIANAANSSYKLPLGSITVRTLSSLGWVRGEISRIAAQMEGDESVGRDLVSEVKLDIDQFLFEKEAPRFVLYQNEKSQTLYRSYRSYVFEEGQKIFSAAWTLLPAKVYERSVDEQTMFQKVLGLREPLTALRQNGLVNQISTFESKAKELARLAGLATKVQATYCDFFQRAKLYSSDLQEACEDARFLQLREMIVKLQPEAPLARAPELGLVADEKGVEVVTDWVTGMTDMLEKLSADPRLFEKK